MLEHGAAQRASRGASRTSSPAASASASRSRARSSSGPKLLLLDEPLAALDKKLRQHTQFELANIQYQLGVTFVVVTHDQEEAMTLSTRIAVMDRGRIVQVGTPNEIYEYPRTRFIADFIGTINMFAGTVEASDGDGRAHGALRRGRTARSSVPHAGSSRRRHARCPCAVRPEKIYISREPPDGDRPHRPDGASSSTSATSATCRSTR